MTPFIRTEKKKQLLMKVILMMYWNQSILQLYPSHYAQLCPSHYLSTAALSWDAMLNMTKVECELISDADMYLFFKKGMRC